MVNTAEKFEFSKINDMTLVRCCRTMDMVNISNAHRSVLIYPPHRQFVGFSWDFGEGCEYYVDNAFCFGLGSAPSIFNSVSNFMVRYMKAEGVSCLGYLNDFLITGSNRDDCEENQVHLISIIRRIGLNLNMQKIIAPSHTHKYLEIIIDLNSMVFRLPEEKLQKTQLALKGVLVYFQENLGKNNGLASPLFSTG